jgi:hypothetical protein
MKQRRFHVGLGGVVSAFAVLCLTLLQTAGAATTTPCALPLQSAYRASNSRSVYYISDACQKRPIKNPDVYFSHFTSWDDVQVTAPATLASIPDSPLSFLPWGPRRTFQTGSLIKTVTDPRIFFVSGGTIRPIATANVFTGLGFDWTWVEDVDPAVIAHFTVGTALSTTADFPAGMAIKYPASPKIYFIENNNGQVQRRYVESFTDLQSRYRLDRIVVLPENRAIPETTAPPVAPVTTPTSTAPVIPTNPTTTVPNVPVVPTNPTTPTVPNNPVVPTQPAGTPVAPSSNTAMVPLTDLLTDRYLGQY